jgi:hypothetical protein
MQNQKGTVKKAPSKRRKIKLSFHAAMPPKLSLGKGFSKKNAATGGECVTTFSLLCDWDVLM